jgi:hypothetical protein
MVPIGRRGSPAAIISPGKNQPRAKTRNFSAGRTKKFQAAPEKIKEKLAL